MFGKKPAKQGGWAKKLGKRATLIAENTSVAGDIQFTDQLFVNGHIEGNVSAAPDSDSLLVVSDVGSVKGEIRAPFVVINGEVDGNVHAHTRVELAANACVSGNVYYELIEMQLGARVDGQLVHLEPAGTEERPNVHPLPGPKDSDDTTRSGAAHDNGERTAATT